MTPRVDGSVVTCPDCASDTVYVLDYSSSIAMVWYLRCKSCGYVWTLPKPDDGPPPAVRQYQSVS